MTRVRHQISSYLIHPILDQLKLHCKISSTRSNQPYCLDKTHSISIIHPLLLQQHKLVNCILLREQLSGRAQPCQGWGREFEPRFPLHLQKMFFYADKLRHQLSFFLLKIPALIDITFTQAGWQSGHAAACKAVYAGSIPTPASISSNPRIVICQPGSFISATTIPPHCKSERILCFFN